MKIYHSIRNCSKIFYREKPFRLNSFFSIQKQISNISSTDHDRTMSGEFCISKLLDSYKVSYKNKFTCLLVRCSFCNNTSLFINKVTGK